MLLIILNLQYVLLGKLLGSGTISDSEIDDAYANAASTIMSPYTSPKFAAEAVLNVITGINQKTKNLSTTKL
jgi:hypothetical protein